MAASCCLVWSLVAYAPWMVLANNPDHFKGVTPAAYARYIAPYAALAWLGLGAVLFLCRSAVPTLMALAASLAIWLTVNLLNWDYGALAGLAIDFSRHWQRGIADGAVWLMVFAGVCHFRRWLTQRIILVAALLLTVMLAGQVALLLDPEKGGLIWRRQSPAPLRPLAVAPRGNVFVVILDMMQTDIAREALALRPDLQQVMTGFSLYPNTVGAGTTTVGSAPALLGAGHLVDPNIYLDWRKRHLSMDAPNYLLRQLADKGYEICQDGSIGPNTVAAPKCSQKRGYDDFLFLLDLGLFRALPQPLKAAIYNQQRWLLSGFGANREDKMRGAAAPYRTDADAMAALSTELAVDSQAKPRFFWLHFMGAHVPIQLGADCAANDRSPFPDNDQGWRFLVASLPARETRQAVVAQSVCYFDRLAAIINKLKALGIYDSSVIIVAADHGDSFGNRREWFAQQSSNGHNAYIPDAVLTAGTPVLAVKPVSAFGSFQERMEPATLCDIPKIILGQIGLPSQSDEACVDIVRRPPAGDRERRFYYYHWSPETWSIGSDNFPDVEEFRVVGHAQDRSSWQPTFRRHVNRQQTKPWSRLDLAAAGSARYRSVAGWQPVTFDPSGAAMAVVGTEARLYFGGRLAGPAQLTLRVSLDGPTPMRLNVGSVNRSFCQFVIEPARPGQLLNCPLPRVPDLDHVVLTPSGAGALPKLIVHEAQLKNS